MSKLNWERAAEQDRMRKHGTEPAFVVGHGPQVHGGSPAASLRAPERAKKIQSCYSCGSEIIILSPATGPHAGGLRCAECNAFRWLSKNDLERIRAIQEFNTGR